MSENEGAKDLQGAPEGLRSTSAEAYQQPSDPDLGDSPAERRAIAEGGELGAKPGEDKIVDGEVLLEDGVGGAEVEQPDVPQPPRLDERGADLGLEPAGFADEKSAPEELEEAITPNQALEKAQAEISRLVAENQTLRRELEESEHEINLYFGAFGPLPEN